MTEVEIAAETMQPIKNKVTEQNFILEIDNENTLFYINYQE